MAGRDYPFDHSDTPMTSRTEMSLGPRQDYCNEGGSLLQDHLSVPTLHLVQQQRAWSQRYKAREKTSKTRVTESIPLTGFIWS